LAVTLIFFMVLYAARAAVMSIDPDIQTVARMVGIRKFSMLYKVVLPASVPMLFAALRLGVTYALLGVIASEMIAARRGLGQVIVDYSGRMAVEGVMAMLLVLAVVSLLLGIIIDLLELRLLRWK
jgi:NitT/TauT family transport system permease protein